jgi:P-type conjugative transfer protein VirB9
MKTRIAALLAAAAFTLFSQHSHAELIATPLIGDTRLVQFNYDEDNTFLVLAKPKAVTHIQFGADELLQSVASGDTAQWELTPTKNRKNLFIKPKFEGIETSMTVITDKRTYQFVLRSTGDGKKWYQRVSWLYSASLVLEQDALLDASTAPRAAGTPDAGPFATPSSTPSLVAPVAGTPNPPSSPETSGGLKPDSLSFNYKIDGEAAFKPTQVFDDGRFTYLRMPADVQELPALFAVIEGQDFALVNYTVDGSYMIAQRLLETAVLKLGKAEVRISKVKPSGGFMKFLRGEGRQ